jgi:hypothetical protein
VVLNKILGQNKKEKKDRIKELELAKTNTVSFIS